MMTNLISVIFNKLVDQWNNTYHHSINKKPINTVYSDLTEKIETNHKSPKFKVNERVSLLSTKIVIKVTKYRKGYTENWSREILIIDSVFKTNPKLKI